MNLRALVTYSDANGVTAVVPTATQNVPAPANSNPVALSPQSVELSASDLAGSGFNWRLDLARLFQDADGDPLAVINVTFPGLVNQLTDFYLFGSNDQLITFNPDTNSLTWRGSPGFTHTHDGNSADGGGNVVTMTFEVEDPAGAMVQNNVSFRINVAPTDVSGVAGLAINETLAPLAADLAVAALDVQDENDTAHRFGTHRITVSDSRFKIEENNDGDGSTWDLVLKAGALIDFETEPDADAMAAGLQIAVDLVVRDGGGLTLTKSVTITINDDASDNPPAPDPVPGLKDNEGANDPDETKDDANDSDDDGGAGVGVAPGGGVFLAPADALDDDLLDSFVLAIDDIDIA